MLEEFDRTTKLKVPDIRPEFYYGYNFPAGLLKRLQDSGWDTRFVPPPGYTIIDEGTMPYIAGDFFKPEIFIRVENPMALQRPQPSVEETAQTDWDMSHKAHASLVKDYNENINQLTYSGWCSSILRSIKGHEENMTYLEKILTPIYEKHVLAAKTDLKNLETTNKALNSANVRESLRIAIEGAKAVLAKAEWKLNHLKEWVPFKPTPSLDEEIALKEKELEYITGARAKAWAKHERINKKFLKVNDELINLRHEKEDMDFLQKNTPRVAQFVDQVGSPTAEAMPKKEPPQHFMTGISQRIMRSDWYHYPHGQTYVFVYTDGLLDSAKFDANNKDHRNRYDLNNYFPYNSHSKSDFNRAKEEASRDYLRTLADAKLRRLMKLANGSWVPCNDGRTADRINLVPRLSYKGWEFDFTISHSQVFPYVFKTVEGAKSAFESLTGREVKAIWG